MSAFKTVNDSNWPFPAVWMMKSIRGCPTAACDPNTTFIQEQILRLAELMPLFQILHGLSVDQLAGDELTPEICIAGQDQELQSFFLSID